jgi:hypothetical protein
MQRIHLSVVTRVKRTFRTLAIHFPKVLSLGQEAARQMFRSSHKSGECLTNTFTVAVSVANCILGR